MSGLEGIPTAEGIGGVAVFILWRVYKMVNDSHISLKNIETILDERLPRKN